MTQVIRKQSRPDRSGPHEAVYRRNRDYVLKTQDVCGICGRPIDSGLKHPHPMSKSLDHIVPISLGGHPFDRENMQAAHLMCNLQKGRSLQAARVAPATHPHNNRDLPQSRDWRHYKTERDE